MRNSFWAVSFQEGHNKKIARYIIIGYNKVFDELRCIRSVESHEILTKKLTKSAKNMYNLTISCQKFKKNSYLFRPKKTHERVFSTKIMLKENQEVPKILLRNPGKANIKPEQNRSQDSCLQPSQPQKNPNHKSSGMQSRITGNKIYEHRKVDQIVVGYGFQPQAKFAAISNHILFTEFGGSQLVKPFWFHVTTKSGYIIVHCEVQKRKVF